MWSYLWRLDETAWQAEAVPAIAALRALPEPDRARQTAQRHRLSVFEGHGRAADPHELGLIAASTSSATSSAVRPSVTTVTVATFS